VLDGLEERAEKWRANL